jgi:hypothetical protein
VNLKLHSASTPSSLKKYTLKDPLHLNQEVTLKYNGSSLSQNNRCDTGMQQTLTYQLTGLAVMVLITKIESKNTTK